MEWKNGSKKDPNDRILQRFALFIKYHFLVYQMKKLLGILVLGFLFSGNANAGVNEPGTGFLGKCKGALNQYLQTKSIWISHS